MRLYSASSSFQRPANTTGYATNALIGNSTVAANVVPLTFTLPTSGFLLTNVRLSINPFPVPANPVVRVHLYQFNPQGTLSGGDGGLFGSNESGYLGNSIVDTDGILLGANFNDTTLGFSPVDPNLLPVFTDTTAGIPPNQIYGLLETLSNFTPTSHELFTVTLIGYD